MPSFTTIYRTAVMIAVGVIGIKAWQLYGPSAEELKKVVVSGMEMAEKAWKNQSVSSDDTQPAAPSGGNAPPFANVAQSPKAINPTARPTATLTQGGTASTPTGVIPSSTIPVTPELIVPRGEKTAQPPAANEDRMTALMSQLAKLGAAEPKLAPWGSSGHLYRFCCRAALADSPALTQHFESVAAEPDVAVEQVVAKVEAWRTARRSDSMLR